MNLNPITKRILTLPVLLILASSAFCADLSGLWQSSKQKLTIKQDGDKLTGTLQSTLGTVRIAEGKIEGNDVTLTFYVILSSGKDPLGLAAYDSTAEEGQVTEIHYKGKISGDALTVKVTQERMDDVRELTFRKTE